MSLQDKDEDGTRNNDRGREEVGTGSERGKYSEDDAEQNLLNELMNQDDSIDDITFADMLSSGEDAEESDLFDGEDEDILDQLMEEEMRAKHPTGGNVSSGGIQGLDEKGALIIPQKSVRNDIGFGNAVQLSTPDQLRKLGPSPVVVTQPQWKMTPPSEVSSTTSDSESSLSIVLPSIDEEPLKRQTSSASSRTTLVEIPSDKPTGEEEEALPLGLSDSINSAFSASFSDAQLPMPSSPSPSPIADDSLAGKKNKKTLSDIASAASESDPPLESVMDDQQIGGTTIGDQMAPSPLLISEGNYTLDPPTEFSPRSTLSVKSPETASEGFSFTDAMPPLPSSKEEKKKIEPATKMGHGEVVKPALPVENIGVSGEGDIGVPLRTITPLRRPPSAISEVLSASEGGVYWVTLVKPSIGGLGLSLVGAEKGGKTSVFIKTVTPGGVTDVDGRIRVGDKVLQVNGQSTVGMTQSKVVALLRKAQGTVKLGLTSGKTSSRTVSSVGPDQSMDTDPQPIVPPLNLPPDLGQSDSEDDTKKDDEISQTESFTESARRAGTRHRGDRDTDSDIDSTADLPDDSNLDLPDDSGNAVGMETAIKATRHIGKVLKDKFHGRDNKDDDSFGSDVDLPLSSSGNNSSLLSGREKTARSARGRDASNGRHPIMTDQELKLIKILQVPLDSKVYSGKSLKNIISVLQRKIDKLEPEEEFKMLRQVKAVDACEVARKPENRDKNRFRNVLPYDKTRVILQSGDSNYVNASHVQLQVSGTDYHFIACQGPLPQTIKDFWTMIWEQGVEVIAMVTLDYENGKVKCHKYWPDNKDSILELDEFEIRLEEVRKLEHFDIRQLTMTHKQSKEVQHVSHLYFTSWPDHSVPNSALPLLRYTRYMRKLSGEFNPLVVHCSAGIGRTGTLITIDLLLTMIETDKEFVITDIVKELRLQRQGMIQTKDQYLFCYKAAVEALKTLP